jgi:hypothetical protein
MKEDDLAKTIAALVSSTTNKNKLAKIQTTVPKYIKGYNRQSLFTKVDHYLTHPPADKFNSLFAEAPSGMIMHI